MIEYSYRIFVYNTGWGQFKRKSTWTEHLGVPAAMNLFNPGGDNPES